MVSRQSRDLDSILYDPLPVKGDHGEVVTLLPRQISHFQTILGILKRNHYYLDTSMTGSGKTYVTMAVSIATGRVPLIVCPKMVKMTWETAGRLTHTPILDIVSYDSLRGTKTRSPKKYLIRKGDEFFPTPELEDLWINDRVLIIFDEIHRAMANTTQMKAVSTIFQMALRLESTSGSRLAMLSATVIDQEIFSLSFFRMIGFIPLDLKLIVGRHVGSEVGKKAKENLIRLCQGKNLTVTNRVVQLLGEDAPISALVYQLLHLVIKPLVQSEMPKPEYSFIQDNKKEFYLSDTKGQELLDLQKVLFRDKVTDASGNIINPVEADFVQQGTPDDIQKRKQRMAVIMTRMYEVQRIKVPTLFRLIMYRLLVTPESKIVVFSDIIEGIIDTLKKQLEDRGVKVLTLTGRNNEKDNEDNILKFNSVSLEYRVILCTTAKGGVGINLHDIYGDRPRYVFMLPSFRVKDMTQAAGRTYREGISSHSVLRVVYLAVKGDPYLEDRIMSSITRKSKTLNEMNTEQNRGRIEYPGDYKSMVETPEEYQETLRVITPVDKGVESGADTDAEGDGDTEGGAEMDDGLIEENIPDWPKWVPKEIV